MTRGRPKLPEGEHLVSVSIRMPKWLVDWFSANGKRSAGMRDVLEKHVKGETDC